MLQLSCMFRTLSKSFSCIDFFSLSIGHVIGLMADGLSFLVQMYDGTQMSRNIDPLTTCSIQVRQPDVLSELRIVYLCLLVGVVWNTKTQLTVSL